MDIQTLLDRQWQDYERVHTTRINLLIHIVATPVFIIALLKMMGGLMIFSLSKVLMSAAAGALAFAAQGIGHSKEPQKAEPFSSAQQAIVRILLEQLVTFPKFVFTGKWYAAWKRAS